MLPQMLGTTMLATGGAGAAPPSPSVAGIAAYGPTLVPHLAFPLIVGPNGSFNVNDQNTDAEVAQCVQVLLGTEVGERTVVPSFGVTDPTFVNPDVTAMNLAIAQWEPRATAVVTVSPNVNGSVNVEVEVSSNTPGA